MEILVTLKKVSYTAQDGNKFQVPALFAAYENQERFLLKLPKDTIITIKTRVSRNLKLHQMVWAVINYVYDNLPEDYEFQSVTVFVDWIKLTVGFTEVFKIAGAVKVAPKSIAFTQCDETEFKQNFFDPAVELMAKIIGLENDIKTGITAAQQLIEQSRDYNGIDYRQTNLKRIARQDSASGTEQRRDGRPV
jgi:hypothetical protein